MLKSVYYDATNDYIGSAQNELNTYLDSVDAKITRVQESWAQIWQSDAATSSMKTLLDIADGAVNLVNILGPAKTAFGVGGAALGQFFDVGRINYQLVL